MAYTCATMNRTKSADPVKIAALALLAVVAAVVVGGALLYAAGAARDRADAARLAEIEDQHELVRIQMANLDLEERRTGRPADPARWDALEARATRAEAEHRVILARHPDWPRPPLPMLMRPFR